MVKYSVAHCNAVFFPPFGYVGCTWLLFCNVWCTMLEFLKTRNRNMTEYLHFYTYRTTSFKSKSSLADRYHPKKKPLCAVKIAVFWCTDLLHFDAWEKPCWDANSCDPTLKGSDILLFLTAESKYTRGKVIINLQDLRFSRHSSW
jgi:hypothetical protein